MSGKSDGADATPDQRDEERRRLIDLTRRDKGLPERRNLGTDRRARGSKKGPEADNTDPRDERA